ncbi:MAG: hypothetical protein CNLJKLNK_01399 [Holosporales bacterium]
MKKTFEGFYLKFFTIKRVQFFCFICFSLYGAETINTREISTFSYKTDEVFQKNEEYQPQKTKNENDVSKKDQLFLRLYCFYASSVMMLIKQNYRIFLPLCAGSFLSSLWYFSENFVNPISYIADIFHEENRLKFLSKFIALSIFLLTPVAFLSKHVYHELWGVIYKRQKDYV